MGLSQPGEGSRLVVLSGASGGGKSTLLAALAEAGLYTVPEPGRRVLAAGGPAPWDDLPGFLSACLALAEADHADAVTRPGPVVFDRCAFDAISGLVALGLRPASDLRAGPRYGRVLLAPPWPELYRPDPERRHGFAEAVAEYERLMRDYPAAGYAVEIIPKDRVAARVAWVVARVGHGSGQDGTGRGEAGPDGTGQDRAGERS